MAWHGMGWNAFRRGNPGRKSRSAPAAEELWFETSYSIQGCDYCVHLSISHRLRRKWPLSRAIVSHLEW